MIKRKKDHLKILLVGLLLSIGLGYAFLQTDLTINGTSKIAASSWDIHFEDLTPNPNSVTLSTGDVAPTIDSTTRTDITYTITLKEPGDFYEFEVAVVNGGTLDAMIGTITNKLNNVEISTTNPLPVYLDYSVMYSDRVAIAPNQLLEAGYSENIKVRLAFRTDIDPEDLPTSGATHTLSFGLSYVQADDNAIAVPHAVSFADDDWLTIINAVQTGNTSAYHVGDTKTVTLGNSLGTHTIRIANMSTPAECLTTGFSETACGFVLEFADIITTHRMNPYISGDTTTIGINSKGGWEYSDMRAYLNSTTYAYENIDYSTTGIYSSLPEVLRNAIIDTSVVSGHNSNDTANFTTTDKLYLLSPHEVWEDMDGDTSSGIDYYDTAYNNTRQLDYYANLGVTTSNYSGAIMQRNGSNSSWWLRSAYSSATHNFSYVTINGRWTNGTASNATGVSPAFRIG